MIRLFSGFALFALVLLCASCGPKPPVVCTPSALVLSANPDLKHDEVSYQVTCVGNPAEVASVRLSVVSVGGRFVDAAQPDRKIDGDADMRWRVTAPVKAGDGWKDARPRICGSEQIIAYLESLDEGKSFERRGRARVECK